MLSKKHFLGGGRNFSAPPAHPTQAETALAQELPYLRQELTWTVGLWNKVITSSGSRFCLIATQSIRGDRNDWNVREPWIGLDAARRLAAIHDRKLDIHQY